MKITTFIYMREPERTGHDIRFVQGYQPCIVYIESYPTLTPPSPWFIMTHQVLNSVITPHYRDETKTQ